MNETLAPELSREKVSQTEAQGLQKKNQIRLAFELYYGKRLSRQNREYLDSLIGEPALILLAASGKYLHPVDFDSVPIDLIADSVIENRDGLYCRRLDSNRTDLQDSPELCASMIGRNRRGESIAAGVLLPRSIDRTGAFEDQCYSTLAQLRRYYREFLDTPAVKRILENDSSFRYIVDPDDMTVIDRFEPNNIAENACLIKEADKSVEKLLEQGLVPGNSGGMGKTSIGNFSINQWNYILIEFNPDLHSIAMPDDFESIWEPFAHRLNNKLSALQSASNQINVVSRELIDIDDITLTNIIKSESNYIARMMHRTEEYLQCGNAAEKSLVLNSLLNKEINDLGRQFDQHLVEYHKPLEQITIIGDEEQLGRAFQEILNNAAAQAGRIKVRVKVDNEVSITFYNDLNKETIEALLSEEFNPFEPYRTLNPDNTGLGLAIAQKIIAAHNGTIKLKRETDSGILVKVTLPIAT